MATTTKLVQSVPKFKPPKPTSTHFYSSFSKDPPTPPPPPSEPHRNNEASKPFSFSSSSNNTPPKSPFDEIRKNLAEFRRRSADSLPPPPPRFPTPSFQELYHQRNANSERPDVARPTGRIDFSAIRQGLKNSSINNNQNKEYRGKTSDSLSLSSLKNSLKLRPDADRQGGMVIGGGGRDKLPKAIFGKEMNRDKQRDKEVNRTRFVKLYGKDELGRKLRELRPAGLKKKEFSLQELSERLLKLRENDEKESTKSASFYQDLRDTLSLMQDSEVDKSKKTMIQRLDILGQLGGTPSFMLHPPKEHLVEKYFHPDNMSSEEKMKLELQKVRDEFKMSESDCGSARVQVAQLTTKIKHLSTVLHKKDKHSRKGLQAMVQKRKKLLKYLRRTDWDSFCLVLSKLGLRDNPDYKF